MYAWRNTYKTPKFFFVDARISFFVLLALLHVALWTFLIVSAVAAFLYYFEKRRGMGLASAIRMIRSYISGPQRPAGRFGNNRFLIDYGRLMQPREAYEKTEKYRNRKKRRRVKKNDIYVEDAYPE